eukprot:CAMPEP_0170259582 /NCGR_PEP_ID=MMETSP0116_2-20130129/29663_1 /TAXON_ID=400756 /ORGANISM="Durinskia baltica, Strain CSIRO CS-38" /LENGTH=248 /DNA_ID=CAMNT_0010510629 /DNA_START=89 /DNA_END=836 /DNA_ORIENTATION=-
MASLLRHCRTLFVSLAALHALPRHAFASTASTGSTQSQGSDADAAARASMYTGVAIAGPSKTGVCGNSPIGAVADVAPLCFKKCPGACGDLESIISLYLEDFDREGRSGANGEYGVSASEMDNLRFDALAHVVCVHKAPFGCMAEEENMEVCKPMFGTFLELGMELPTTKASLEARCAAAAVLGAGAAGRNAADAGHHDYTTEDDPTEAMPEWVDSAALVGGTPAAALALSALALAAATREGRHAGEP